ncbi:hypothetical protein OSH10_03235 [Kaistia defluvii]|uniref:hypothetical protein n=1 Tax=Kaistia defluvii TaxID=410841 RepID=UPI00225A2D10|nr:hypothetical protein [Kaistia defluvii]MCX5517440.1 hypothetical protein [Kaistia defluvii]
MAGAEQSDTGRDGIEAAIRHFPAQATDIEALARESERFRDLCEELVEAEAALSAVDELEMALRAERRLEWLAFVRWALKEIDRDLRQTRVVSINRTSRSNG